MTLAAGSTLGPYEVIELLGAGGMGEVYRARDPRLGRDVAVKVLPEEVAGDAQRLGFFEREARAVAALNHPNILTVHDVGTHEDVSYVVTELLEGENLRELVSRRSPTVRQILAYALQAARGLEAAHAKDIVHRDLKPENLFLTTDGRVKVLDFGLAKLVRREEARTDAPTPMRSTIPGQVVGTVAYMSPEQARAHPVDARSDVFSFGAVLYELLAGKHPFKRDAVAATLTAIVEETPAGLESLGLGVPPAVGGIVRRCLEKAKEDRYTSGHDVAVALEAVLAAPSEAVSLLEVAERSPYPGLQSFTEKDASVFFGREREVEELWGRIRNRKLLAVIGPSGVGKTSFLRAGVMSSRPEGWAAVHATPGSNPALALAQALTAELAADAESIRELLAGVAEFSRTGEAERVVNATKRWRSRHAEALVVVDQFEEVFTLNPPEVQEGFAKLLKRLASEAEVHVVLSVRDDFLIRCSEHGPLAPVFESLTPLTALSREGLRRAVVEPAKKRGYRFEDEALVDEIVSTVEGVRGALPLLAFAVARLWEKRDRERKLFTREAYQEIAGVEGALAQHAEATMDKIGPEHQGLVREIFRNLVTAQGTRAVMSREELLSVFPNRAAAEGVLRELIDARLLTSYEVEGKEDEPSHHRIEVIHESLLRAWPRLVRWQTQDEDGAQLRDQLKQAAHLWEEKGRTPDLLWSGTAFREFELWRERYLGKLTALEEDFSRSMVERARRRRRLRRGAVAAVIVILAGVAGAIAVSRQQTARARDEARAEARRAEAGKLIALARNEIDRYPTAALAYARKSLDLADTAEARRLVVEVLWRAPVARVLPVDRIARQMGVPDGVYFLYTALSPDGLWLATRSEGGHVLLFPADGGPPRALPAPGDGGPNVLAFTPKGDRLVTGGPGQSLRFLSLPDLQETRRVELGGVRSHGWVLNETLLTFTRMSSEDARPLIRAWPLAESEPTIVGRHDWAGPWDIDASGRIAFGRERTLFVRPLDASPPSSERVIGRLDADLADVALLGEKGLVSVDTSGEVRLWSGDGFSSRVLAPADETLFDVLAVDREGRRLAVGRPHAAVDLYDLGDPPDATPVRLDRPDPFFWLAAAFDSKGAWLATNNAHTVAFWSLSSPWRRTLRHQGGLTMSRISFSSDGRWLGSAAWPSLWSLDPENGVRRNLVSPDFARDQGCGNLAFSPDGEQVLMGTASGGAFLVPVGSGSPRRLETGWEGKVQWTLGTTFDASGRRAAAAPFNMNPSIRDPKLRAIRVWDLPSGEGRTYSLAHLTDDSWWGFDWLRFAPDGSLLAAGIGAGGVTRLVLPSEADGVVSSETLYAAGGSGFDLSADGRHLLVWASRTPATEAKEELLVLDLVDRTSRRIATHGQRVYDGAIDASGHAIVTGDTEGVVRVGPATGEEPHLLLGGHQGVVWSVAISPDGRWIASVGDDAIRLWPMPDVTKPPLHTLPHAELTAKLDSLTNLRVVADPTSSTGWTLDVGTFPGWETVPEW